MKLSKLLKCLYHNQVCVHITTNADASPSTFSSRAAEIPFWLSQLQIVSVEVIDGELYVTVSVK